jgi:hypothetical protein
MQMSIRTSAVRALLFAAVAAFLALAYPHRAFAGTLQIRDDAHVLAGADAERLRSAVASAPFDAHVAFTNDYAEADDLSRYVGSLVDEPNVVAVGVDPRHHHVQVHFGRGSGIARTAWPAIETAGNGDFREGNWAAGVGAIFRTASNAVTNAPASPQQQPAAGASRVGSMLFWALVIGGGIAAFALFARRRSGYGVGGPGYPGYGGGPYPGAPYGGGPYGGSPGGMGPVGGGIIGAGLGGLAGYELGKVEGEREERIERERGSDDDRGRRNDDNDDAGGGGSSWDDGGGGGSDGGGGGFDGGDSGGGSDF